MKIEHDCIFPKRVRFEANIQSVRKIWACGVCGQGWVIRYIQGGWSYSAQRAGYHTRWIKNWNWQRKAKKGLDTTLDSFDTSNRRPDHEGG